MSSTIFFFLFIPLLSLILLTINIIFAPHNPYTEKNNAFECGFTSFLGQNRIQFSISFFIFALLFLLFDLEILLVYPYLISAYINEAYGLLILMTFLGVLTIGFIFELGKKALTIDSRQTVLSNFNLTKRLLHIIPNTAFSLNLISVKSFYKGSVFINENLKNLHIKFVNFHSSSFYVKKESNLREATNSNTTLGLHLQRISVNNSTLKSNFNKISMTNNNQKRFFSKTKILNGLGIGNEIEKLTRNKSLAQRQIRKTFNNNLGYIKERNSYLKNTTIENIQKQFEKKLSILNRNNLNISDRLPSFKNATMESKHKDLRHVRAAYNSKKPNPLLNVRNKESYRAVLAANEVTPENNTLAPIYHTGFEVPRDATEALESEEFKRDCPGVIGDESTTMVKEYDYSNNELLTFEPQIELPLAEISNDLLWIFSPLV